MHRKNIDYKCIWGHMCLSQEFWLLIHTCTSNAKTFLCCLQTTVYIILKSIENKIIYETKILALRKQEVLTLELR